MQQICLSSEQPSSGATDKTRAGHSYAAWAILAFVAAMLAACGSPKYPDRSLPDPKAKYAARNDQPIGTVVHTDRKFGFVLVDVGLLTGFEPGTGLEFRREGKLIGTLRITPQAIRPFLTADVVEGKPEIGDLVYRNE